VPFSAGGGVDTAGRTVATTLTKEAIVTKDIRVENREGGSGLVGMTYINSQAGRADRLMVLGAHIVSTPLLQETNLTYADFTPLATLYADYVYFFVRPDSPIQSLQDIGAALKADPGSISLGGSVPGGPGHLATAKLAKGFGVDPTKINYVPFDGDEALTALLGGHIDVGSSGPEGLDLVDAGQLKVIGISAEEPQGGRSEGIPTFKQGGSEESFVNFRIILAPPELDPAATKFWQDALTKMSQTQAWKDASAQYGWSPYFQTDGLEEFLASQSSDYKTLLVELGVING
jgi:putative tricarboxylic transport membrane protein